MEINMFSTQFTIHFKSTFLQSDKKCLSGVKGKYINLTIIFSHRQKKLSRIKELNHHVYGIYNGK